MVSGRNLSRVAAIGIVVAACSVPVANAQGPIGRVTGAIGATELAIDDIVFDDDRLQTDAGQSIMVYLDAFEGVLFLAPETDSTLAAAEQITISTGWVRLYYRALEPGQTITLTTPLGSMSLSGSVVWAAHDAGANETVFGVEDTTATVQSNAGGNVKLEAGQYVVLRGDGPLQAQSLSASTIAEWEGRLNLTALLVSRSVNQIEGRALASVRTVAFGELTPGVGGEVRQQAERVTGEKATNQKVIDTPILAPTPGGGELGTESRVPPPRPVEEAQPATDPSILDSARLELAGAGAGTGKSSTARVRRLDAFGRDSARLGRSAVSPLSRGGTRSAVTNGRSLSRTSNSPLQR